jgi:predicted nucleic acid-binding protein
VILTTLDTNVLASDLLGLTRQSSTPCELLRRLRADAFQLATSEPMLVELERKLMQPFFANRIAASDMAVTLALLQQSLVPLTRTVHRVVTHPEDDIVRA